MTPQTIVTPTPLGLGTAVTQLVPQADLAAHTIVLQVLQMLVPALLAGFFLWLVTHYKGDIDARLEELKVDLKRIGDAEHVRFQAVYQRQFDAAILLLSKQHAILNWITHLRVAAQLQPSERIPQFGINLLRRDAARKLIDAASGYTEAFAEHGIWLEEDARQAAVSIMEASQQLNFALVRVCDASDKDLEQRTTEAVAAAEPVSTALWGFRQILRGMLEPKPR